MNPAGYAAPTHRVQEVVRAALENLTGASHGDEVRAVDGCSIPTYALPLTALAFGFAKFGTGVGLSPSCAKAAARIRRAVAAHPFMVAGTGRFDTVLMERLGERAFVKAGAEGVHCAALPELGYGIAVKCDDGAKRAAEVVLAALIRRFLPLDGEARDDRCVRATDAHELERGRGGRDSDRWAAIHVDWSPARRLVT
jgi:L-asparaginase II